MSLFKPWMGLSPIMALSGQEYQQHSTGFSAVSSHSAENNNDGTSHLSEFASQSHSENSALLPTAEPELQAEPSGSSDVPIKTSSTPPDTAQPLQRHQNCSVQSPVESDGDTSRTQNPGGQVEHTNNTNDHDNEISRSQHRPGTSTRTKYVYVATHETTLNVHDPPFGIINVYRTAHQAKVGAWDWLDEVRHDNAMEGEEWRLFEWEDEGEDQDFWVSILTSPYTAHTVIMRVTRHVVEGVRRPETGVNVPAVGEAGPSQQNRDQHRSSSGRNGNSGHHQQAGQSNSEMGNDDQPVTPDTRNHSYSANQATDKGKGKAAEFFDGTNDSKRGSKRKREQLGLDGPAWQEPPRKKREIKTPVRIGK